MICRVHNVIDDICRLNNEIDELYDERDCVHSDIRILRPQLVKLEEEYVTIQQSMRNLDKFQMVQRCQVQAGLTVLIQRMEMLQDALNLSFQAAAGCREQIEGFESIIGPLFLQRSQYLEAAHLDQEQQSQLQFVSPRFTEVASEVPVIQKYQSISKGYQRNIKQMDFVIEYITMKQVGLESRLRSENEVQSKLKVQIAGLKEECAKVRVTAEQLDSEKLLLMRREYVNRKVCDEQHAVYEKLCDRFKGINVVILAKQKELRLIRDRLSR